MTPHDIASAAMTYIERGWAVVALHDVVGGACSCGSADPRHAWKQGGKHPLEGGWQNRGMRRVAEVRDAWARRPGANLGIVTGRASGVWVLDVDPDNGGDKQLAGLVSAFGALPETYAVRTGSGGTHYYWTMPDFDFTNSRGRLPLGLDVRGNASQVVAPPSHTLKGPYSVVLDVAPVAAPGWLLEMIRPPERVEPVLSEWSGWEPEMVEGAVAERGPAYAAAAVREVLAQLAAAQPGERNTIAYRVGRRLAELVAAPWARLSADQVWAGYMSAAAACDVDGGFTQAEAYDVLVKAVRGQQASGRVADLPPATHLGTVTSWTPPPHFD
ncbi:MAG TPA: bifunctional DNA primase/polymerase, partial [Actinoplanes sp.]|nr:bifunctional DNA primase/polymerase [Actinoplanes sp.]